MDGKYEIHHILSLTHSCFCVSRYGFQAIKRPLMTATATGGVICTVGDIVAQEDVEFLHKTTQNA